MRRNRLDRDLGATRRACEDEVTRVADPACVSGTDAAARENCVLRCMAPPCYEETYGSDPLEDGEVDTVRGRKFRVCAKAWLKDEKERKARRERGEEM
eukprot:PRCOL_00006026-RA